MAIAIKSFTSSSATPGQVTLTTSESPSATAVGDLVVVVNGNNFYALSNMATPTATGSPTMNAITNAVADGGTNLAHIKGWWYVANTAGAQTLNVTETGTHDEEKYFICYVLSGADTTTAVDAAANSTGTTSTSWVAPSVSPVTSDAFLIVVANSGGGAAGNPFTTPGTYTEDADFSVGASNMGVVAAHKQLSVSGATGTITFTASSSQPYAAVTITILAGGAVAAVSQVLRPGFMTGSAFPAFLNPASQVGWSPIGLGYDTGVSGPQTFLSSLTAALSFTGTDNQAISKILTATVGFTGTLARRVFRALAATLAFTGALGTAAVHNFTQALTATLSFTGTQTRRVGKALTATVSFTGTQARSVGKAVAATVSFTGAQTRRVTTSLVGATLSFTGALTKRTARALAATASFTGTLGTAAVHVFTQALTATLSFTGTQAKRTATAKTATLSFTGSQVRRVGKGIAAALSFTGAQARRTSSGQTASVSFTGATTRRVSRSLTATLSFTGSLASQAVHVFTQALTASVGFSGAVVRRTSRSVSATVGFTVGALTRRIGSSQSATVGFVGGLPRAIGHGLSAAIGFVGNLLGVRSGVNPPDTNPLSITKGSGARATVGIPPDARVTSTPDTKATVGTDTQATSSPDIRVTIREGD